MLKWSIQVRAMVLIGWCQPVWPDVEIKSSLMLFTVVVKGIIKFGYFLMKICHQGLSKIAQSGHTYGGGQPTLRNVEDLADRAGPRWRSCRWRTFCCWPLWWFHCFRSSARSSSWMKDKFWSCPPRSTGCTSAWRRRRRGGRSRRWPPTWTKFLSRQICNRWRFFCPCYFCIWRDATRRENRRSLLFA